MVPMRYRYVVTPDAQVNSFKPKEVTDISAIRPQQFGAIFHGKYNAMPTAPHCDVVWEDRGSNKKDNNPQPVCFRCLLLLKHVRLYVHFWFYIHFFPER